MRSSGIKSEFDKTNENKNNDIKSMCKSSSPSDPVSKLSVCDSRIAQLSCHQDERTTKKSVSSTSGSVQEQHFASKVQEEKRASKVEVVATPKMQEKHVTKVQEPDISSSKEEAVEEDEDGDFFSQEKPSVRPKTESQMNREMTHQWMETNDTVEWDYRERKLNRSPETNDEDIFTLLLNQRTTSTAGQQSRISDVSSQEGKQTNPSISITKANFDPSDSDIPYADESDPSPKSKKGNR